MDLSLVFAASIDWARWGYLAQGILALGVVIFIHEFGHFAAAKLCGVRVEKFYVGFDPYGLRLFSFRWGETEYGIGAIPLGGYVYMLGQTDNPGKQAEEAERAKALKAGTAAEGLVEGQTVESQQVVWDPRSYPAQSVPERMFIISAGVIMNAITAFLFATTAYMMGVDFPPTYVYEVAPGSPAWQKNIRINDEIVKIDDIERPRWDVDLRSRVMLADLEKGLTFRIKRDGKGEFDLLIHPQQDRKDRPPTIGVSPPRTTSLAARMRATQDNPDAIPAYLGSPAFFAEPKFVMGDEITKIDDTPITGYGDVLQALVRNSEKPLKFSVRRSEKDAEGKVLSTKDLTIEVTTRPMHDFGLAMEIGPISGVQDDSPAAAAGLKVGDVIKSIDGEPLGDPMTLAERMRRKQKAGAGKAWKIAVERPAGATTETVIDVVPREADWVEQSMRDGAPISVPTLGIAMKVGSKVASVVADGPAAKAGVKVGDKVERLEIVPNPKPLADGTVQKPQKVDLTEEENAANWAYALSSFEEMLPGATLKLELAGGRTVDLTPQLSTTYFNPQRGLIFDIPRVERKANDLSQAFTFAAQDTRDSMTQVYRFLHAMWIGQIPKNNVGGIISIATQAGESASGGFSTLLLFLMMLSCNLAVLNFMPFPVLDGGHMVFLTYEAIFRRPPPERFVGYLNLVGLVCLLFLMGFALKNDIVRIAGW